MKKTQFINLLKTISRTLVSFLAILIFLLGSTALYAGLTYGAISDRESVNVQMEKVNYRDLQITFPYGVDEDAIAQLQEIEGVSQAEGYNYAFASFTLGDTLYQAKLIQLTETIDLPYQIEGTLPAAKGEIAIEAGFANEHGIRIGDTIRLDSDDDGTSKALCRILNYDTESGSPDALAAEEDADGMAYLTTDTFTVTALVECAAHMSTARAYLGVNENTLEALDCIALVDSASLDMDAFLGYRNVLICSDRLRGLSRFSDEYTDGEDALQTALSETASALSQEKSSAILNQIASIQESMESQYADGMQQLSDAQAQLDAQAESIDTMRQAQKAGITDYDSYIAQYDDAAAVLEENSALLEESRQAIDDFAADTSDIRAMDCSWLKASETTNLQYAMYGSEAMDKIKSALVGMFMLICLLVCYSAISRIVNDQVTTIGTLKALGLNRKEITLTYLFYTGSAAFIGAALGLLVGTFIIQPVSASAGLTAYTLDGIVTVFRLPTALILCLSEIVAVLLITLFASLPILKKNAISLLQGPEPPKGTEYFFEQWTLWKKLMLFNRTIVKNTLHETRRVIGTLIGIAGCCALIIAGLTLNDNMVGSLKTQFNDYYHFDTVVMFDGDAEELQQVLSDEGISSASVTFNRMVCYYPSGKTSLATVFTPDDEEAFSEMITIEPFKTSAEPLSGVWFGSAFKTAHADLSTIEAQTLGGDRQELDLDGFFACHLDSPQMIVGKDAYADIFGQEPEANALLVSRGDMTMTELKAKLSGCASYCSASDFRGDESYLYESFSSLSGTVVGLFLGFSAVLAVMVLLNILTMFVQEKKKEIIVLMINGYTLKQVKKYISNDTILLTVVGILLGCFGGHYMGLLFVHALESDMLLLLHTVDPIAMAAGIVGCGLASFIMCMIALRQIAKFRLTDITKY